MDSLLTKITKEKLLSTLYKSFNRQIEYHNEHTFDWSNGYYRCYEDMIKFIENYTENANNN